MKGRVHLELYKAELASRLAHMRQQLNLNRQDADYCRELKAVIADVERQLGDLNRLIGNGTETGYQELLRQFDAAYQTTLHSKIYPTK